MIGGALMVDEGEGNVTAKIGEGGMGQVWQATDTKPNRQVALKVLPQAF